LKVTGPPLGLGEGSGAGCAVHAAKDSAISAAANFAAVRRRAFRSTLDPTS